jgi:hypothetical protein
VQDGSRAASAPGLEIRTRSRRVATTESLQPRLVPPDPLVILNPCLLIGSQHAIKFFLRLRYEDHFTNRKNKFPVGEVMLMLFTPPFVETV